MKGMIKAAVALAAVGVIAASDAQAQMNLMVGGGLSVPSGSFGSLEDGGYGAANGFNALAGVQLGVPMMPLKLRVDGSYNRFSMQEETGTEANYQVLGATANAVFALPTPGMVQPYLLAGVGVYNAKLSGDDVLAAEEVSETKLGINGGVGVNLSLGGLSLFGEARMHNVFMGEVTQDDVAFEVDDIRMIPVTVGLRIGG